MKKIFQKYLSFWNKIIPRKIQAFSQIKYKIIVKMSFFDSMIRYVPQKIFYIIKSIMKDISTKIVGTKQFIKVLTYGKISKFKTIFSFQNRNIIKQKINGKLNFLFTIDLQYYKFKTKTKIIGILIDGYSFKKIYLKNLIKKSIIKIKSSLSIPVTKIIYSFHNIKNKFTGKLKIYYGNFLIYIMTIQNRIIGKIFILCSVPLQKITTFKCNLIGKMKLQTNNLLIKNNIQNKIYGKLSLLIWEYPYRDKYDNSILYITQVYNTTNDNGELTLE